MKSAHFARNLNILAAGLPAVAVKLLGELDYYQYIADGSVIEILVNRCSVTERIVNYTLQKTFCFLINAETRYQHRINKLLRCNYNHDYTIVYVKCKMKQTMSTMAMKCL